MFNFGMQDGVADEHASAFGDGCMGADADDVGGEMPGPMMSQGYTYPTPQSGGGLF